MEIIYFILTIHFLYIVFIEKIKISIYVLFNLLLIVGFIDFYILKFNIYNNPYILNVTFIYSYILNTLFCYSLNNNIRVSFDVKITKKLYYVYLLIIIFRVYSYLFGSMYGTHSATDLKVTGVSNIIGVVNNAGIYFFVFFLLLKRKRETWVIGTIETAWFLIGGSKMFFIFIISIIAYNKYQNQRIKKTILLKALLIIIIFPYLFVTAWNFRISSKKGDNLNLNNIKKIVLMENQAISDLPFDLIVERFSTSYFYDKFLTYSENNPYNEYSSGEHFLNIFLWYIPRSIWPDKPSVSYGRWVGEKVYGWKFDARSEAAVSLWGDLYNSFGIIGIILGPLLINVFLYFLFFKLFKDIFFSSILILVSLNRLLFIYEQNINSTLIFLFSTTISTFVIYKILFKNVHTSYHNL